MKYKIVLLSIFLILACVGVCFAKPLNRQEEQKNFTTRQIEPLKSNVELHPVEDKTTFTGYSLSIDETDENPCMGAGNNNLCKLSKELKNKGQIICASRDLPLDTIIYIEGFGECVIKDRMSKKYKGTNRVDILFGTKQEAINFGKQELKYVII